jgi:hypothetical protein
MTRFTVVTRIRMLAVVAPLVMLIAAPFIAGGLYVFGGAIEVIHDRELAAMQAARGMDTALYQMEWARTQPERAEIMLDQQRAFAHSLELAGDRSDTDSQRQMIATIAQQADPLFDQMRNGAPDDEIVNGKTRDLHGRIADLIDADDTVLLAVAAASRREAMRLMITTLVAGVVIPWLCFVVIYEAGGRVHSELQSIRQSYERLRDRPSASALIADSNFTAIDDSLSRLGFPKPNPMLAE